MAISDGGETVKRTVVLGGHHTISGIDMVEVVTGLEAGEEVVTDHE